MGTGLSVYVAFDKHHQHHFSTFWIPHNRGLFRSDGTKESISVLTDLHVLEYGMPPYDISLEFE